MNFVRFALPLSAILIGTSPARAYDYSDWQGSSSGFREGYIFALLQHQAALSGGDPRQDLARRQCLSRLNSRSALEYVDGFVRENPIIIKNEMLRITLEALAALCGPT